MGCGEVKFPGGDMIAIFETGQYSLAEHDDAGELTETVTAVDKRTADTEEMQSAQRAWT